MCSLFPVVIKLMKWASTDGSLAYPKTATLIQHTSWLHPSVLNPSTRLAKAKRKKKEHFNIKVEQQMKCTTSTGQCMLQCSMITHRVRRKSHVNFGLMLFKMKRKVFILKSHHFELLVSIISVTNIPHQDTTIEIFTLYSFFLFLKVNEATPRGK